MNRWNSARVGAVLNWLAFMATLLVALALTPFLIRNLGTARYDVWCVAEAILAYFTVLDLGIAACLVRLTARLHTQHNIRDLNRTAAACMVVYSIAALVTLGVGAVVLNRVEPRLQVRAGEDVFPFLLLMLANVALALPLSVFPTVLEGLQRFTLKSLLKILFLVVRTGGMVWSVDAGYGLTGLGVVTLLVMVVEHAVMGLACRWALPGFMLPMWTITRGECRGVVSSSVHAFVAMLSGRVTVQMGAILIGLLLPAGQATAYTTAMRLVEYAKNLLRTLTATLTPGMSAMQARGDLPGIRMTVLTASRVMLYLVLPIQAGLWCFGGVFLKLWVGETVSTQATIPLLVLSSGLSCVVMQSVFSRVLYGLGELKTFARYAALEAGITLALMAAFMPTWGTLGVATAVATANVCFSILVIRLGLKTVGLTVRDYLWQFVKPVVMMIPCVGTWMVLRESATTWRTLCVAVSVGLVVYCCGIYLVEGTRKRFTLRLPNRGITSSPV
jgi:O-antigen/teichoic acid export membrane protein